jgi:methyl-accepting chemotaxis protein
MTWKLNSIKWKLLLPLPIIVIVFLLVAMMAVPRVLMANSQGAAIENAIQTVTQFKVLRSYYTQNVIAPILADSSLTPSSNHDGDSSAVPLPATMIHDLSALLSAQDTTIALYSDFPFPIREDRVLDPFQRQAWTFLTENPDEVFSREETVDGARVMRVAVADRMAADACVDCHNSHADTPRTGWSLGDVRGVLQVDTILDQQYASAAAASQSLVVALIVAGLVLMGVMYVSSQLIVTPIEGMAKTMNRLAGDDLDTEIPYRGRHDEIGELARTVEVFKVNAVEKIALEKRQQDSEAEATQTRHAERKELAQKFEAAVGRIVKTVAGAASELTHAAEFMANTSEETSSQAVAVTTAAAQATANVETVAAATEEMSVSVKEIGQQAAMSSNKALFAESEAIETVDKMQVLTEAAQKIGTVVNLIQDITEQTNLLALNATIEAARAGDAGKGFAVVASEVKQLAAHTASATRDIAEQIDAIQNAAISSSTAITSVSGTISELTEIATSIAGAVEEQSAATQEIASNVQDAATGTRDVSSNISGVNDAASEASVSAAQVLTSANELSTQSDLLDREVADFMAVING